MTADTQRALSRADMLRAQRNRLAAEIAATEEKVAATLAARARTRPQDADRLMALSRKAAAVAARERQDAQDRRRRAANLISNAQCLMRQSDAVAAQTIQTVLGFAGTEDKVAATFAKLARTRPQDAARLQNLSEQARRQAAGARQWAAAHSAAGAAAAVTGPTTGDLGHGGCSQRLAMRPACSAKARHRLISVG
jgi:hypothetical protein